MTDQKSSQGSARRAATVMAAAGLLCTACEWYGASSYTTPVGSTVEATQPATAPANVKVAALPSATGHDTPADLGTGESERSSEVEPPTPQNVAQVTYATEGCDFDPSVTPDGSRLVFASTQHRATSDIYVKSIDGRVVTQLTSDPAEDVNPAVSPDGTKVAFASNRSGNWDVYVMPISGGRPVQITNDPSDEIHPSWSPDGKSLVFSRLGQASGRWEMWVTDATNQATCQFIGFGLFPRWCPVAGTGAEGTDRIVFQLTRERGQRAFGIWTLDYKDGQASNLTELAGSSWSAFINPTWSPNGKHVVYAAVPNPAEWRELSQSRPSASELWLINVDGSGKVNLTPGSSVSLMPAWGANGRLFFVAARAGVENIWSIDMSGPVRTALGQSSGPSSETAHADEDADHGEAVQKAPIHEGEPK